MIVPAYLRSEEFYDFLKKHGSRLEAIMPYHSGANPAERSIRDVRVCIDRLPGRWFDDENIYKISLILNSFRRNRWGHSPREMLLSIQLNKWRLIGFDDDNFDQPTQSLDLQLRNIYNQIIKDNQRIVDENIKNARKVKNRFKIGQQISYRLKGNKSKSTGLAKIVNIDGCQITLINELGSTIIRHAVDVLS